MKQEGEKKGRFSWKRYGLCLIAVGLLSAGGTWAYRSLTRDATNRIRVSRNTIEIDETFEPPQVQSTVPDNTDPDNTDYNILTKQVRIRNTDSASCFVRAFLDFSDSSIKDLAYMRQTEDSDWVKAEDYGDWLNENSSDWAYIPADDSEDGQLIGGYYYYKHPLKSGEETTLLLDSVKVAYTDPAQIIDYDIIVTSESIQTYLNVEDSEVITDSDEASGEDSDLDSIDDSGDDSVLNSIDGSSDDSTLDSIDDSGDDSYPDSIDDSGDDSTLNSIDDSGDDSYPDSNNGSDDDSGDDSDNPTLSLEKNPAGFAGLRLMAGSSDDNSVDLSTWESKAVTSGTKDDSNEVLTPSGHQTAVDLSDEEKYPDGWKMGWTEFIKGSSSTGIDKNDTDTEETTSASSGETTAASSDQSLLSITYDANGGYFSNHEDVTQNVVWYKWNGKKYVLRGGLSDIEPQNPGYKFVQWQTSEGTAFQFPTTKLTDNITNITASAQWELAIHTITYNASNISRTYTGQFYISSSSKPTTNKVDYSWDGKELKPSSGTYNIPIYIPSSSGASRCCSFDGWQLADGTEFVLDTTKELEQDITVYAKWVKTYDSSLKYTIRYAVTIYNIEDQDADGDPVKDDNDNDIAITFGPATGASYRTTYASKHYPTLSSGEMCIHYMTWKEIIRQAKKDPTVFETCLKNGCRCPVLLTLGYSASQKKKIASSYFTSYYSTVSGDGVSGLYYTINSNYTIWNNTKNNYGGWPASRIRATLNGYDDYTGSYADNGTIHKKDYTYCGSDLLSENDALISCFPDILQKNICRRAVKSDTSYELWGNYDPSNVTPLYGAVIKDDDGNDQIASLVTTYDKLWLPSTHEIWNDLATGSRWFHKNEGAQFARMNALNVTKSACSDLIPYNEKGAVWSIWLRSIDNKDSIYSCINYKDGSCTCISTSNNTAYALAPCFSISKSAYVE
jgi:hypothetical protein